MLSIDEVIATLQSLKLPADILIKAETELEAIEQEKKAEKEDAPPKAKNQTHLVVIDQDGKLANLGDFVGFSVQIPIDAQPADTLSKIHKAAYAQNASGKKKKWSIKSLGEIGDIKRKFLKAENVSLKSGKELVQVIFTDGVIPQA